MKKVIILDGNEKDEEVLRKNLGSDYDISSFSFFEFNNLALSTVITIANTLDSADPNSAGRSLRIAVCARDIAKNLGWDEKACQNIYFVALLHDIGMLTVSEMIRNKPGRLIDPEYDEVKTHTQRGAQMLREIDVVKNLPEGIMYHHERWDGTGYPKGLSKEDIPVIARIIAIADAYDAMNSDRVYRSKLSTDKIISEFVRCKGSQFDPEIADVFIFMLKGGYSVDPSIEQIKAADNHAFIEGGLRKAFDVPVRMVDESEGELDTITGLFTRSYLNTRVSKMIYEERSGALMVIDVAGLDDDIIKKFSDRLRSFFREEDIVCRISPDRFAAYVGGESGKVIVKKKAGMIVDTISSDTDLAKYKDKLKVAIGISMCQEDGLTFEELYGAAIPALEDAKGAGWNTYRFRED